MTELRFETFTIPGAPLNGESPFPAMRGGGGGTLQIKTDEQDGLFVGYGKRYNSLPHTMQDRYGNDTETLTFQSAVLENDYIRAVFLPEAGGHLWSLYDKKAKRNLVQTNESRVPSPRSGAVQRMARRRRGMEHRTDRTPCPDMPSHVHRGSAGYGRYTRPENV